MAKVGVIHYNWPGFSFEEFLKFAAEIGCSHVELQLPDVWPDLEIDAGAHDLQNAAARARREVEAHGLQVSALAAHNDFAQLDEGGIASQVARMKKACEIAKALGEDTLIRSEGGNPKEGASLETQWNAMRECFTRCAPFLDELEVSLAIDNHGHLTNDGDRLFQMLEQINHPRVGSNLDTMNFRWYGNSIEDCNRFYEMLAPRVLHAHMKDGFGSLENYSGAALGEGEIDLGHALKHLKAAGFDGVYCAEYEGSELEGGVGYRKCVEWLHQNA